MKKTIRQRFNTEHNHTQKWYKKQFTLMYGIPKGIIYSDYLDGKITFLDMIDKFMYLDKCKRGKNDI